MRSDTRIIIMENINRIGNNNFCKSDIKGITLETFLKYVKVEHFKVEKLEEVSLEEVIELLNDCAGDECYDCDWEYRVIDNKPFKVTKIHTMRIVKVLF